MKRLYVISVVVLLGTSVTTDSSSWRFVEVEGAGHYWQNQSFVPEETVARARAAINDAVQQLAELPDPCPEGMVYVHGDMRTTRRGSIEWLQNAVCIEWLDPRDAPVRRCGRFDRERWLTMISELPTHEMDFCIDRFEYPNRIGEYPAVSVSWNDAAAICGRSGSRLCTEDEWTFACEGEEATPYPYGYERDSTQCNIDKPFRDPHNEELYGNLQPHTNAGRALSLLWQGAASGEFAECTSPFGVYDMTGNVDEWTTSVSSSGYPSILKGGYWGRVRDRCRPSTRVHSPSFVYYQQGFRCCTDAWF